MDNIVSKWRPADPKYQRLANRIRDMIYSPSHSDMVVIVANISFTCKWSVINAYTNFFNGLEDKINVFLPPNMVTPKGFALLYEWMLTDNATIAVDGFIDLFMAAHFFRVPSLINQVWFCMEDPNVITEYYAFQIYMQSKYFRETDQLYKLKELLLNRIGKFFMTLVATKEWLQFEVNEVLHLLNLNSIGTSVEPDIFFAAVRWLIYSWNTRKEYVDIVMQKVRFTRLPINFLIALQRGTNCNVIKKITGHPTIKKFINLGIAGATGLYYETQMGYVPRGFRVEPERRRVYDSLCPYIKNECIQFSYKDFVDYICEIQKQSANHWESIAWLDEMTETLQMI